MVCLGNMCMDTLHKGDDNDDDNDNNKERENIITKCQEFLPITSRMCCNTQWVGSITYYLMLIMQMVYTVMSSFMLCVTQTLYLTGLNTQCGSPLEHLKIVSDLTVAEGWYTSKQDEYSWTSMSQWCALSKKVRRPLLMICHTAALLDANRELIETCILIKIKRNCPTHCRGNQSFTSTLNSETWVSKRMKLRFVKHLRI